MSELSQVQWRKSSRSNGGGACVEVATNLSGDSKNPDGPVLAVTAVQWRAFVAELGGRS